MHEAIGLYQTYRTMGPIGLACPAEAVGPISPMGPISPTFLPQAQCRIASPPRAGRATWSVVSRSTGSTLDLDVGPRRDGRIVGVDVGGVLPSGVQEAQRHVERCGSPAFMPPTNHSRPCGGRSRRTRRSGREAPGCRPRWSADGRRTPAPACLPRRPAGRTRTGIATG